jgi:dTDP-4-dehydrorhamnose reductase
VDEINSKIHVLGASSTLAREVSAYLLERRISLARYARSACPDSILIDDYEIAAENILEGDIALIFFAVSSPRICQIQPDYSFLVNVNLTNQVIHRITSRGGRAIFISSDAVYGATQEPANERTALRPIGNYGKQKATIEELWGGKEGFVAIRSSLNVSSQNQIIKKIMSDQTFSVLPNMYRNVLLSSDLAALIYHLITLPQLNWPITLNAGGPDLLSVAEFFSFISESRKLGKIELLEWDEFDRASKPSIIEMDSRQAYSMLGREFNLASKISFT